MIKEEKLYDLDDVMVIPAPQSNIEHRGEIKPYYTINGKDYLPIFVSPMDCVISKDNFHIYKENNVIPILPRTEMNTLREEYTANGEWCAYGLSEFVELFCYDGSKFAVKENVGKCFCALIDNANGHMAALPRQIKVAKELSIKYGYTLTVMAGNVANPWAYKLLSDAGADMCRCAIGNGNCCITASNTGTNMPMASLIDGCRELKTAYSLKCAIVADGGISGYDRAIKALAIGADYIMIGSTFGKCFESASEFINCDFSSRDIINDFNLNDLNAMRFDSSLSDAEKKRLIGIYKPIKALWGMSTRKAQIRIWVAQGKKKEDIKLKTSEGVEKHEKVQYTLHQWLENFRDYLRSSMSYCNSTTLEEYIGKQEISLISEAAKRAINK